jgi:hypothetical protein
MKNISYIIKVQRGRNDQTFISKAFSQLMAILTELC